MSISLQWIFQALHRFQEASHPLGNWTSEKGRKGVCRDQTLDFLVFFFGGVDERLHFYKIIAHHEWILWLDICLSFGWLIIGIDDPLVPSGRDWHWRNSEILCGSPTRSSTGTSHSDNKPPLWNFETPKAGWQFMFGLFLQVSLDSRYWHIGYIFLWCWRIYFFATKSTPLARKMFQLFWTRFFSHLFSMFGNLKEDMAHQMQFSMLLFPMKIPCAILVSHRHECCDLPHGEALDDDRRFPMKAIASIEQWIKPCFCCCL